MNGMKKRISMILSGLLALSMIAFSMTGCLEEEWGVEKDDDEQSDSSTVNGKTPEELYVEALNAVNTSTNWELNSTQEIKMTMKFNGQTQKQEQTQTTLQKMNGDNVYVKVGGSALEMETWYVDGMLYTISQGVKAKAKISLKDYPDQYMSDSENTLLNIPEDWFEDVKFEKKDGKNCLNFHVSGDQYSEVVGDLLDSMVGNGVKAEIGEVDYTVVFDKLGNIEQIICDFSASFDIEGIEVEADYHTVTDVKIGASAPITAPEGADSFIDVTDQMGSIG